MKKTAIVIVNYNDYDNTNNLVNELKSFKNIDEIVVVDSGSTDDSLKDLKKNKDITVIESANLGYSHALNAGSKYLVNKYNDVNIILSNSDISIKDEKVIEELNKMIDDTTKVCMPAINENGTIKYGWRNRHKYIDLLNNVPFINRLYRDKLINYKKDYYKDIVNVDCIYGCFFMVDGITLKDIGYFDENVFLYFEEDILAKKLKKKKLLSKCNCNIFVYHMHNATIGNNVSNLNKYKIHAKSKFYYEKEYNHSRLSMILFKLFYYINLVPYKIKAKKK